MTRTSKSKPARSKSGKRETPAEKRIRHLVDVGDFLQFIAASTSDDETSRVALGHEEKIRTIVADLRAANALRSLGHVCGTKGGAL